MSLIQWAIFSKIAGYESHVHSKMRIHSGLTSLIDTFINIGGVVMMIMIRFAIILLFSAQLVGCYTLVVDPSSCKCQEGCQKESTLGGGRGGSGSGQR